MKNKNNDIAPHVEEETEKILKNNFYSQIKQICGQISEEIQNFQAFDFNDQISIATDFFTNEIINNSALMLLLEDHKKAKEFERSTQDIIAYYPKEYHKSIEYILTQTAEHTYTYTDIILTWIFYGTDMSNNHGIAALLKDQKAFIEIVLNVENKVKSKLFPQFVEPETQITIKGDQFYSFYSAAFTNEIAKFSEKRASIKAIEDYAVINADQGTLKIIDYSTLKGKKPNTLAKKLLDICTLKVSQTLVHGATFPNTRSASFTVEELAELTNQPLETDRQREKFIERIYSSLTQLKHLYWQQSNKKKIKKFSDFLYNEIVLVESTGKYNKNTFYLLFSESAARILAISPVCESFPTNLFKAESRYSNAYEIGRKLISHTNIYNNRIKGNNCTLSVKKIIENTSIPTFEEIIEIQKRRDWKEKIKKPLERDLNNLLAVGVLSRWEYRDPKGNTYTSEQANDLNAIEYQELMMDFSVCYSDEEQSKRLISEEKHINKAKNKKSDESNGQTI